MLLWILTESRYGQQGPTLYPKRFEIARSGHGLNFWIRWYSRSKWTCCLKEPANVRPTSSRRSSLSARIVAMSALGGNYPALIEKLKGMGKPVVLISLGNPYLLRSFPDVSSLHGDLQPRATARPPQ